jgi:hypothetical protein
MAAEAHVRALFEIARESRVRMERAAEASGFGQDLHRLCAPAAMDLFRSLAARGFRPRFVVGRNHCFCTVGVLIVDTTATQFANADPVDGVWIADGGDPDLVADPGAWDPTHVFDAEADATASPIWSAWPEAERPARLDSLLASSPAEPGPR